jgi:Ser/Thr protein kinase RdoA (MazF antagonist)
MKLNLDYYKQHLKLEKATFALIDHDDTIVAIVYNVTDEEKQFALKIHLRERDYYNELYCLKYFANKLPVPNIIQVIEPKSGFHGAILMEYVYGSVLKAADMTDSLAFHMGSLLAQIHLNRLNGYGDLIYQENLTSDPRFNFAQKFHEITNECSGNLSKDLLEKCRAYFNSHTNLLQFVDGPCITHRDFRPGNIIASNDKIKSVIDWSSARASFAQEDFCRMEHGEWSANPTSKKQFLEGYASVRPIPEYNLLMPLLRMCKALDIIGFTIKRGTWNKKNSSLYQINRKFLENFFKSNLSF